MGFQIDVKSTEAFKREILDVPGVCQIVELYSTWCGPAKAIQSTFKRIFFDAGDKPMKFYTVSSNMHMMQHSTQWTDGHWSRGSKQQAQTAVCASFYKHVNVM